jgi:hypothetical protein
MTETKIQLFESFYWFEKEPPPYFCKVMSQEKEDKNVSIIKQMLINSKDTPIAEVSNMFAHTVTTKGMDTPVSRAEKVYKTLNEHILSQLTGKDKHLFEMYHQIHTTMLQNSYIPKPLTMEVLFFPSYENENKFLELLDKTTSTLDICVYNLTNHQIAKKLTQLFRKGIVMRIITDDQTMLQPNSLIYEMVKLVYLLKRELE